MYTITNQGRVYRFATQEAAQTAANEIFTQTGVIVGIDHDTRRDNPIYDQHKAAFANVSAYVILHKGERVASIAFKFPRDGAGRLYVYVHWLGVPMVRGYAGGYGYDKQTAACANAAKKMTAPMQRGEPRDDFCYALETDGGHHWDHCLREAGFDVIQAV